MKFALGFMAGTVAGAVLMGQAIATVWRKGRWKEWVEDVDAKLSIRYSEPRQLTDSLENSYLRDVRAMTMTAPQTETQVRWNQKPL